MLATPTMSTKLRFDAIQATMRIEGNRSPQRRLSRSIYVEGNHYSPRRDGRYSSDFPISPSAASHTSQSLSNRGSRYLVQDASQRGHESSIRSFRTGSIVSRQESRDVTSRDRTYDHLSHSRNKKSEYQRRDDTGHRREKMVDSAFLYETSVDDRGSFSHATDHHRVARSQVLSPRHSHREVEPSWQDGSGYGYDERQVSSASGSKSQSSSSETSTSYTTSFSDDEFALNANCMNTLFNKDGTASKMIHCAQAGPNGEMQLKMTLPLPNQLMKGLEDFVPTKDEIQTAMERIRVNGDKFAKKCNFDYSKQQFDEQVIEGDFAARVRPEFYKSLFESQTEATSTIGDERGVLLSGSSPVMASRIPESAFSPNPNRPSPYHLGRESNSMVLGPPRPVSLPSHIEIDHDASYLSSQDSNGLTSLGIKKEVQQSNNPFASPLETHTIHARKVIPGDFFVSDEAHNLGNHNGSPRMFLSHAKKAKIPVYDFDEPEESSSLDKIEESKPAIYPGFRANTNDWVPARKEQLDLVDQACPSFDVSVKDQKGKTRSAERLPVTESNNPDGIPNSVRYNSADFDCDIRTSCSDLTVDYEAFGEEEYAVVKPVSLSDQSSFAKPKLQIYPGASSIESRLPTIPQQKRGAIDNHLSQECFGDELMGPSKVQKSHCSESLSEGFIPAIGELAKPFGTKELEDLDPADLPLSTTEEVPMDEQMNPESSENQVVVDPSISLFTKQDAGRFSVDEGLHVENSNGPMSMDEETEPGRIGRVSRIDQRTVEDVYNSSLSPESGLAKKPISVLASSVCEETKAEDLQSLLSTNRNVPSFKIPIDEADACIVRPGKRYYDSEPSKLDEEKVEAAHSRPSEIEDDARLTSKKSVSSSSRNELSQVTEPHGNKNPHDDPHDEPGELIPRLSLKAIEKPHKIDFAARLRNAAAARLESMEVSPTFSYTNKDTHSTSSRVHDATFDEQGDCGSPNNHAPPLLAEETDQEPCELSVDKTEAHSIYETRATSEIDACSHGVEINYIGDRSTRFLDSHSVVTEPAIPFAHTSTTFDASQTITTMETPLRAPPGGTFDTLDRSAWSSLSGSHFKKGFQPASDFYYLDEIDEDYGEDAEFAFDEKMAKLSSLLPAACAKKDMQDMGSVMPFNLASFFLNIFTALWIFVVAWSREVLGYGRQNRPRMATMAKGEPNFRSLHDSRDIQTTTSTKIQGRGRGQRILRGQYDDDDAGTVVEHIVPGIHDAGGTQQVQKVWRVNSSAQSVSSWQGAKLGTVYSNIRRTLSRGDARSVASMKDWTSRSRSEYTEFIEE